MNRPGFHMLALPLAARMLKAQAVLTPTLPRTTFGHSPIAYAIACVDMVSAEALLTCTAPANDAHMPKETA